MIHLHNSQRGCIDKADVYSYICIHPHKYKITNIKSKWALLNSKLCPDTVTLIEYPQIFPPMSDKFNTFTNDPVMFLPPPSFEWGCFLGMKSRIMGKIIDSRWNRLDDGEVSKMSWKENSMHGVLSSFHHIVGDSLLRIWFTGKHTQIL